jgi:hypothetical protein
LLAPSPITLDELARVELGARRGWRCSTSNWQARRKTLADRIALCARANET